MKSLIICFWFIN